MKKLLVLLAVLSLTGQAQIQFARGDSASRPSLSDWQPGLDTNTYVNAMTLWVGTTIGNRPIGGDGIRWGTLMYGTATSSNDSITVTIPHGPYAYSTGMALRFKADSTNGGATYINVNGRGWKQITKNGTTALDAGDFSADGVISISYDGTQFQLSGTVVNLGRVAVDIVPDSANVRDIGSASLPFDTVYAGAILRGTDYASFAYMMIPNTPGWVFTAPASATGFTQVNNDTILVWGMYIAYPIKLGKVALYTGTLTGSPPARTASIAAYNSSKALVDSTAATGYTASNVMPMSFVNGNTIGPGWVYFAFSTYISTSGTMRFAVGSADVSYATAAILSGQSTTSPIISRATEVLSAGAGWPSTITLTRIVTTTQVPIMHIFGTDVD